MELFVRTEKTLLNLVLHFLWHVQFQNLYTRVDPQVLLFDKLVFSLGATKKTAVPDRTEQ